MIVGLVCLGGPAVRSAPLPDMIMIMCMRMSTMTMTMMLMVLIVMIMVCPRAAQAAAWRWPEDDERRVLGGRLGALRPRR